MYDYTSTLGDGTFKKRTNNSLFKTYEKILFPIAFLFLAADVCILCHANNLGFI